MSLLQLPGDLLHYITNWLYDVEYASWMQTCTLIHASQHHLQYHSKSLWGLEPENRHLLPPRNVIMSRRYLEWTANHQQVLTSHGLDGLDGWPRGLKSLCIHTSVVLPLDELPNTLTKLDLTLKDAANRQPLDHLPLNLHTLCIKGSCEYTQSLDCLPDSLHTLILEAKMCQPLDHLPLNLHTLCIKRSREYTHSLDYLPDSLHALILETQMSHCLDYLPASLKELKLYGEYKQPLDHLPNQLRFLELSDIHKQSLDHLPCNLKHLGLYSHHTEINLDHLPKSLYALTLQTGPVNLHHLPENLGILHLLQWYRCDHLQYLPVGLKIIHLFIDRDALYFPCLPPFLQELDLGWGYPTQKGFHNLPATLKKLTFSVSGSCIGPITWPSTLEDLTVYNHDVFREFDLINLPPNLQYLYLQKLNEAICRHDWPKTLHWLSVCEINTTFIPRNHVQIVKVPEFHPLLNRSNFPDLKVVHVDETQNNGRSCLPPPFDIEGHVDYDLFFDSVNEYSYPRIWPLRLFLFGSRHIWVEVNTPWSERENSAKKNGRGRVFCGITRL
jgi:hypothetical protein